MIDLHVHLSGSLKPTTIIEYAKEKHISLPTYHAAELEEYLKAPARCRDASEFYDLCDMNDWILPLSKKTIYFKRNYLRVKG